MSDSREIANQPQGGAIAEHQSQNFLAAILEAARDPSVDASKVESMANLAMKLQDRERETAFNRAKNAAMMEMPVITKDGRIIIPAKDGKPERQQGRFARFEDTDRVVRPILARHNMAISFEVSERQSGGVLVRPILTHANGYTERGEAMPVPADTSGSKNAAQAIGSSVQYGKRYTMCSMLNIVTEGIDDDGNFGRGTQVTLPHEREQLVTKEAEEAHQDGRYVEWFSTQSPKDRAWLVASGKHAEYGGPALPAPRQEPRREATQSESDRSNVTQNESAKPEPEPETKPRAKLSPEQWVDRFIDDVGKCRTGDRLDEYLDGKREDMTRLKTAHPELWKKANDASNYQRDAINEGRIV